jgi:hypothetical protein
MALESSSASDGHYRRNTEPMTLEPNPLSNGLEAHSANGATCFYISAEHLWGYNNDKTYRWLDTWWYEIEIGTTKIGPIRWEEHRE